MNAAEIIKQKQIEWARNRGIKLARSEKHTGYVKNENDNFFLDKLKNNTEIEFNNAAGNERTDSESRSSKIKALHSSAALGVNVFDYWRDRADIAQLCKALGLFKSKRLSGEITFERKFNIQNSITAKPHLDAVIEPQDLSVKLIGIECKFTEAYGTKKKDHGFQHAYFDPKKSYGEGIWEGLINTNFLAHKICPKDDEFKVLDVPQLIKHILGLNRKCEGEKNKFRLLYLWYDALGEAGSKHRYEIEEFANIVREDGVQFHHISYQEFIIQMAEYRIDHPEYVQYLTERYL